jgi:hypothetical protein
MISSGQLPAQRLATSLDERDLSGRAFNANWKRIPPSA